MRQAFAVSHEPECHRHQHLTDTPVCLTAREPCTSVRPRISMPNQSSGVGLPVKLSIAPASATLALGATLQLSAVLTDVLGAVQNPTTSITWTSSNPALATVNESGLVQAFTPDNSAAFNVGGTVEISCVYPWCGVPETGSTIDATATITVLGSSAGTTPLLLTQDKPVGQPNSCYWARSQYKVVPESLLDE
jgi:Bacterial Ig-like domain (group 2)